MQEKRWRAGDVLCVEMALYDIGMTRPRYFFAFVGQASLLGNRLLGKKAAQANVSQVETRLVKLA